MKPEVSTVTVDLAAGSNCSRLKTGKLAKTGPRAGRGTNGDNVVLATATANPDPARALNFFPLTVDYREYTYAGGRFPGGFIKREGPHERPRSAHQPPDRSSRKANVRRGIQVRDASHPPSFSPPTPVTIRTFSELTAHPPLSPFPIFRSSVPSALCASARSVDSSIINPTYDEMRESTLNIMVVGTTDGIVMIESGAKEVSEEISRRRD